ncbi:3-oxoacyl-ACP synthase III [Brachybacterium sp. P6-10-X1]|uniref:3-oxoacyl-ACP synthase III n=1 Tax=Brachybacterium sp. P6-10-X1 TaxID=1903186 RepID=UPI000971911E|nr:3-oxoacyl-ACP synthase III [Brachybacterium sp. P6-10-X1]APX32088.1 3-oxoacyl-ACP synthase III [Brachybacterium sp. P6-10-X1]
MGNGNTGFVHRNASLLSVEMTLPQVTVTSDEIDDMLAPARKRLRLPKGVLQRVAGVYERRWWKDRDNGWKQGVVLAAERAMAKAGIMRDQVGLMINASVSRQHLEPAVSTGIHHSLGMPPSCMNFDITNACLGFVNAMTMAAGMIDAGQIKYALIVGAEDVEEVQRGTIDRLNSKTSTRDDFNNQFASLTLGSGAAAAVIGPADEHPEGHRLTITQARAGTQHHELCVADMQDMRTDSAGLLENGIELILDTWKSANEAGHDFKSIEHVVPHQVSMVYTRNFSKITGVGMERIPVTFPDWGNIAAEAVPMTLAHIQDDVQRGERVLLMGVGSGLNTAMMEVQW